MKRIFFPLSLFFLLFWAVLWAQTNADSTARVQLDTLIAQEKFSAAAEVVRSVRDTAMRNTLWKDFEDKAEKRVDMYFDSFDYKKAIEVFDSTLLHLNRGGRADSLATAYLWSYKALAHKREEQFSDVIDAYNEAIRIYEYHKENSGNLAFCYKNVAQSYIRRHDYVQANKCLQDAIRSDSTGKYLLSIYGQLANNAYWQNNLEQAMYYFEEGKKYSGEDYSLASLQSVGSDILRKKGRWREAESLQRKALAYYQYEKGAGEGRIRCYTSLADIAANTRRVREAEALYRQAEREGKSCYTSKSREMAKLYCEWGDFLLRENRETEALALYQKALVQAFPKFDNLDPAANPKPAESPIEVWAMNAPARKAGLLLRNPTRQTRALAADCFDLAFAAAERLRRAYGTDDAKLYFVEQNYDLHREAALNLWKLHRASGDAGYLTRLFDLLEKNRANALRDALLEQKALASTGIPDSLLLIEDALHRDIAGAQNSLAEADTTNTKQRQTNLKRLERRYDDLLRVLRKNYPRFNEYTQAGQPANLDSIRNALPPKATLLSFFDAGDRYLCLVLRREGNISAYEVPRDSAFDQALAQFQALLSDKSGQEADPAAFFDAAYFLKQRLLPGTVLANSEALIVVPDGRLSYLPFEALLTAPHKGAYGKAPYLLRTHAVQYAWSAALLAEKPVRALPEKPLLHVAPFPTMARDGLAVLPNSLNEKPKMGAAVLLQGEQARADTFLRDAAAYDVLHLSTHAHAGQREQPGIEFADRTVALPEIYAQRLNASLVALSACETNAGEFAEGEGVLSLARAFAYAGARSLVASYWSVNDRSTANLFASFYEHLQDGMTKSEALRQAKLDLLDKTGADARKAPYHWAAFTLSGSDGPVALPQDGWPWWAWGLVWAGALILMYYYRRKYAIAP